MSEKMLTEEGLPAVPTTSNDDLLDIGEIDVNAADETNDEEESNLSEPDHEPSQRSPKDAKKKKDKKENRRGTSSYKKYEPQDQKRNQSRKRRYSETRSEERTIEQSEEALKALNRHSQRGTCPKTLQYKARARIRADEAFTTDIKRIRKTTEQDVVNALIRYHERRIAESKKSLKRQKRPTGTVNKKSTDNKNTHEQNVKEIAENFFKKFNEFKNLMNTMSNKSGEKYACLLTKSNLHNKGVQENNKLSKSGSKKRKERKTSKTQAYKRTQLERNKGYIKNLYSQNITDHEINLLSKGLKFIPTPLTKEQHIRRQLLQDFEQFARRMRLKYIFHGQNNKPHPYHVKSNWIPQVQPSVALESYLEEVKLQLAEIKLSQPKNNLSSKEREALQSLKRNKDLNVKKADKGSCVVIMDTENKINEGQTLLDNSKHYRPLDEPMVKETQYKVKQLIQELHENKNVDDMTKK